MDSSGYLYNSVTAYNQLLGIHVYCALPNQYHSLLTLRCLDQITTTDRPFGPSSFACSRCAMRSMTTVLGKFWSCCLLPKGSRTLSSVHVPVVSLVWRHLALNLYLAIHKPDVAAKWCPCSGIVKYQSGDAPREVPSSVLLVYGFISLQTHWQNTLLTSAGPSYLA